VFVLTLKFKPQHLVIAMNLLLGQLVCCAYRNSLRAIYSIGVSNSNITICCKIWLNMIGNVCIRSRNWRAYTFFRHQTTAVQFNLLVLLSTILQVYCRNPRWSKPQGVYCLCQEMYLVVLVLKQL